MMRIQDVTRNPNPIRIQDVSRNLNPTRIQYMTHNPNLTRISNVIRNPYPIRIEDPWTYDGSPKKMKETLHMLIQAIWAQSTNLNQSNPFGEHGVHSGLKFIHLVQIEDLGPSNVIESNLDALSPKEYLYLF